MAKQRKQNAIDLTNQIKSETAQINWQEKKHHGVSQEETNAPIRSRCQPITFKPPQRLQRSC